MEIFGGLLLRQLFYPPLHSHLRHTCPVDFQLNAKTQRWCCPPTYMYEAKCTGILRSRAEGDRTISAPPCQKGVLGGAYWLQIYQASHDHTAEEPSATVFKRGNTSLSTTTIVHPARQPQKTKMEMSDPSQAAASCSDLYQLSLCSFTRRRLIALCWTAKIARHPGE